jgi:hypothetical protein
MKGTGIEDFKELFEKLKILLGEDNVSYNDYSSPRIFSNIPHIRIHHFKLNLESDGESIFIIPSITFGEDISKMEIYSYKIYNWNKRLLIDFIDSAKDVYNIINLLKSK